MPVYEFECPSCGTFEVSRSMAEVRGEEGCPDCGATSPRIFSAFGLLRGARSQSGGRRREAGEPKVIRKMVGGGDEGSKTKAQGGSSPRRTPTTTHQAHGHGRPWMMGH